MTNEDPLAGFRLRYLTPRERRWARDPDASVVVPVPLVLSSVNWAATLAAISSRGPRCERCGGWTFRPQYLVVPKSVHYPRLCPDCSPDHIPGHGYLS